MKKKLMILGASILQIPAIKKAKEMGLDVIVVDMNPNAIGFSVPDIKKEIISTVDSSAILQSAKKHRIDGIMTLATDMPMRVVAEVAGNMGLVGIDQETALKATNKAEMRKALRDAGVPIPQFFKVTNENEYNEVVKNFDVPIIVKPLESSGSRGIFKINDIRNEEQLKTAYEYCNNYSNNGEIIVEEYMTGPEVSVETLSIDGRCHVIQITDKETTGAPHFVEIGHSQPTKSSKEIVAQIVEITKAANKAIGIKNGPSHTEIIITSEGPKIVEIGARLGGDNITTHLVPLSTGVNMVEATIRIALGEKPNIKKKWRKGAAIRYFNQKPGVVKKIEGIEYAEKINGIKQVSVVHGVGERVNEINSSGSRMGFVIAQSDDRDTAIVVCNEALKYISIEIGENE